MRCIVTNNKIIWAYAKVQIHLDMYFNIFRKSFVGLFHKYFCKYFWSTVLERIVCRKINFQKNKYELKNYRSSRRRCSVRNDVLRNFAKFTEKHLCQSLFLNKVAGLTFFTEHLRATASGIRNRDEAKRKAGSYFNFFKRIF